MADAPRFRLWPPVALGLPLLAGIVLTAAVGDPFELPEWRLAAGAVLMTAVVFWNGWCLVLLRRHRTALLPGGSTVVILDEGPFGLSRNPLYLGLTALTIGLALWWPSSWALVFVPVGFSLLWWGAVVPEEHYLASKFGDEYRAYRARVRRWI